MADIFGDERLFSEFEKDRDAQNIFIHYDKDEKGAENRSRIIFRGTESDECTSEEENVADEVNHLLPETKTTCTSRTSRTETSESEKISVSNDATPHHAPEVSSQAPEISESKSSYREQIGSSEEESLKGFESEDDTCSQSQTTKYQVQFELKKMQRFSRLLDSTRCVPDDQSPGVQVIFQNNKFSRKYRARIEQFIISLTEHADKKEFSRSNLEFSNRITVPSCVDLNKLLPAEKRTYHMWQAHAVIGCAQFHQGFMVDSRGWPLEAQDPSLCNNWEVPKYYQVFDEVYPPETTVSSSAPVKPAKPKNACFNCGGDHRLNECKMAQDMERIRTNRREHQKKSAASTSYAGRYHKDPELDSAKKKFKPGKISDELREAMGLQSNQLPSYIYRMRLFGYPPGWLMEANRRMSSLAMYDKDGRETNLRGESLEDGEVREQSYTCPDTYDIQKIIEYPGFTVPVPLGFVDESANIGMPPIQQHQLKKTLLDDMSIKESAKKHSLEEEETEKRKRMKPDDIDMELEENMDVAPHSKQGARDSKAGEDDSKDSPTPEDGSESPTMDKLQEQYLQLVKELGNEGLENTGASTPSSANGNTTPLSSADSSTKDVNCSRSAILSAEDSISEADVLRQTNFSFKSATSISKDYGTPILIKESLQVLPSPEKFSQGIEDHIPFENLPDSVGTFERMRNIFKLIKDTVKGKKK